MITIILDKSLLKKLSIIFFILLLNKFSYASNEIKIIKKVNNEVITNYDIKQEINYLVALNNNLNDLGSIDKYKIAEESLTREKIKLNEIEKFIDLKEFDISKILNNIISNVINDLNLKNRSEFEYYLENYNLKISDIEEKLTIEVLWNQLIASKYKDKININENKLLDRIKKENLNKRDIYEYDLSEIVFQAKNQEELNKLINSINQNILNIGFKNTAIKFSISNTAKFGGKIGNIKESQLSKKILNELNKIKIGEYTSPLKIGSGFMILLINDKKIINEKIDEKIMLKNMVDFEKQKQFDNFSQVYFNKIKINTYIDEF